METEDFVISFKGVPKKLVDNIRQEILDVADKRGFKNFSPIKNSVDLDFVDSLSIDPRLIPDTLRTLISMSMSLESYGQVQEEKALKKLTKPAKLRKFDA